MISGLADQATAITAVVGAVGLVFGWLRWVRPRWRAFWSRAGGVSDAILGRDAIVDRITGAELVPAQPGVGVRLAHQEQQMELLAVTVTKLVDQQIHQQELGKRVDGIELRTKALEEAAVERVVSRVESAQMFQAMDTAIKATPPPLDD